MIIYDDESATFTTLDETKSKDYYCIFVYDSNEDLTILSEVTYTYNSFKELTAALSTKKLSEELCSLMNDANMTIVIRKINAVPYERD